MATDQNQDQLEVLDNKVDKSGMMDHSEATENEHDYSQTAFATVVNQRKAPFGFLRLPAEIRNKIYRLALFDSSDGRWFTSLTPPALTLVNRQIFAEALPIYYAGNNFYLLLCTREDDLSDQDPALFHRFTELKEYFGRRTTSPTDDSPMRYIRNIVVQINTSTYLDPLRCSKVYSTVMDNVETETANAPAYSSLCIRGEQQRMTFTSDSTTEGGPFDPTKYEWVVRHVTSRRAHRFCSLKEAYDLVKMSFTGSTQSIEEAIREEYHAQRVVQGWMASDHDYYPMDPYFLPRF